MRLIGEVETEQHANLFSSYLLVQGIKSQVDQDGQFQIWIKDEDQFKEAHAELQKFVADPENEKYLSSVQQAKILVRAEEKKRARLKKKIVRVNPSASRKPPLTLILIGACIVVGLFTELGRVPRDHAIYQYLQFVSMPKEEAFKIATPENHPDGLEIRMVSLMRGEVWRAVTPIFIHYGIFHIIFNMYWLFLFGKRIELRYGSLTFGLIVLATAVCSNVVQCAVPEGIGGTAPWVRGEAFITAVGGMSGVVYGLFGFFWMKSLYDRASGFRIPDSTVFIMIAWLFFCMLPAQITSVVGVANVANWAHGIGLLSGMAIGYLWRPK